MSSKLGLPIRCLMFSLLPVKKLSKQMTCAQSSPKVSSQKPLPHAAEGPRFAQLTLTVLRCCHHDICGVTKCGSLPEHGILQGTQPK